MKQVKKISVIVLVLFALGVSSLIGSTSLSYGAQGGISLSNMIMAVSEDGGYALPLNPMIGAVVGGYVEYPVWKDGTDYMNLKAQSGLQYFLHTNDFGIVMSFHYIQIPILMKLGLQLKMPGEVYLFAGLSGGYLLTVTSPDAETINIDLFNRVELLALTGMGFTTPWGLSFDVRYQMGLNSRTSEDGGFDFSLYDSTVSLVASYEIP